MSGREILVDTNIFLYLLKGNVTIEEILQGKIIYLSVITELELIGFSKLTTKEEKSINQLLSDCKVINIDNSIKNFYSSLRKKYHLKLADAIIAATSISLGIPLITADKQFQIVSEINLITYQF
jgi:predicted nucleic acid-binding protein